MKCKIDINREHWDKWHQLFRSRRRL